MPSFSEMENEMNVLRRKLESARMQMKTYPKAYGKIVWDLENAIEELKARMDEMFDVAPVGSD